MNRRRVIVLGSTLVVLVLVGLTYVNLERKPQESSVVEVPGSQLTKVSLCMKWRYTGTMAPYFAGRERGIFEKHGLDLQVEEGGPVNPSLKAVLGGKANFGITGAEDIVRARSRDLPVKAVAVIFRKSPVCFLSLKARGIETPEDFRGKTISVSHGENAEYEFRALLKKFNISSEEITEERFTFTYERLLEGKIDVAPAYAMDQYLMLKRQGYKLNVISGSDYGINPYADVLFTTEKTIGEDAELVEAVASAVIESWDWARNNVNEAAELFVKMLPEKDFELDLQGAILHESVYYVLGDDEGKIGFQELQRWQETVALATEYGELEKKPTAEKCFTNEFVERFYMKYTKEK